jgi:hypothetical protein
VSPRARHAVVLVLVVLGGVATTCGAAAVYAHHVLVDKDGFADSVAEAVRQPAVSRELSVGLADALIDAEPDLIAAERPIEDAASALLESGAFEPIVRRTALFMHDEAFAERGQAFSLDLADGLQFLASVLSVQDPRLRAEVERVADAEAVRLENSGWIGSVTTVAQVIPELALILPLTALALFAIALALSRERGRTLAWVGVAVAAAGAALLVADLAIRSAPSRLGFAVPDAVEQALDVFLRSLLPLALLLAVAGGALAAAGWGSVTAASTERTLGRTWTFLRGGSETTSLRVGRAVVLLAAALFLLVEPLLALQVIAVAAGFVVLVEGLSEVVALLGGPAAEARAAESPPGHRRRTLAVGAALAIGLVCLTAVVAGALIRIPTSNASLERGCNGSVSLCDRPLDRVALPASHNAMSSANAGFIDPNNRRTIVQQLDAGIRGLLIDSHVARPTRFKTTALTVLDPEVVAAAKRELGPQGLRALEDFLSRRIVRPTGPPRPYFCHIVCELGAIRMDETLTEIKAWMDANPRDVIVIDIQDLVSPIETERLFKASRLYDMAYVWKAGTPAPTLRQMIDANKRLLVVAEVDGYSNGWYQPGYARLLKETPYANPTVASLRSPRSCRPNRGKERNPLFLVNHWVAVYPPRLSHAQFVNRRDFLEARVERCRAIRGAFPNLIAVDFASAGDVVEVAAEINGVSPAVGKR